MTLLPMLETIHHYQEAILLWHIKDYERLVTLRPDLLKKTLVIIGTMKRQGILFYEAFENTLYRRSVKKSCVFIAKEIEKTRCTKKK